MSFWQFYNLSISNPKTILNFEETSPTHFNAYNGDYKLWSRNYKQAVADMHSTKYVCIDIRNDYNGHVYENKLIRDLLTNNSLQEKINIIPIYENLLPFYKLKNSHYSGKVDCAHFVRNKVVFIPIYDEYYKSAMRRYSSNTSCKLDAN